MPSIQRQEQIISLLVQQKSASTAELVELFDVSEWTVRRDLDQLEAQQLVRRFRGGVRIIEDEIPAIHQSRQVDRNLAIKQKIGKLAARLLRKHKLLAISASSTARQVACALAEEDRKVHVLTNGIKVALVLSGTDNVQVTCVGGMLDKHFNSLNGLLTEYALREFTPEVAVIGVNGISKQGLSVESPVNAHTIGLMAEQAMQVMVVADHSKVDQTAAYRFAALESVDVFVTDRQPSRSFCDLLDQAQVSIFSVDHHLAQ